MSNPNRYLVPAAVGQETRRGIKGLQYYHDPSNDDLTVDTKSQLLNGFGTAVDLLEESDPYGADELIPRYEPLVETADHIKDTPVPDRESRFAGELDAEIAAAQTLLGEMRFYMYP